MNYLKELMLEIVLPVIGLLVSGTLLVIGLSCSVLFFTAAQECKNLHRLTGLETDATVSLGCMAKYKGRWVSAQVVTNNKQEVSVEVAK